MDLLIAGWLVLVGLVAGVVSGLFGVGGGIVVVPALMLLAGLPFRDAVAASLLFIALSAPLGAYRHWRAGNVRIRLGLLLGATGFVGVLLGEWAGRRASDEGLVLGFALILALAARQLAYAPPPRDGRLATPLVALIGLAGGFVAKLFGVGGGIVVVPALALNGIPIHAAVGTSLLSVATNGSLSTLVNLLQGHSWLPFAIPTAIGALIGIQLGAWQANRIQAESLRRLFSILLLLVAVMMAREAV